MYSAGVPIGMLIDSKGPRPAVVLGSILLGIGYYPLHVAYSAGHGSVPLMCFFSYLTGLGGCMAFNASVKTSALNWPHHRGTATAFPLAAFGLSAFFFSLMGSLFFPGDPSRFLLLLAYGTFAMTFVGFFFLRVYPHTPHYQSVSSGEESLSESQTLRRSMSHESKTRRSAFHHGQPAEPGTSSNNTTIHKNDVSNNDDPAPDHEYPSNPAVELEAETAPSKGGRNEVEELDETSSLMSRASTSSSLPGEVFVQSSIDLDRSHRVDIRGWALLKNVEFWQLWVIMGILSGIGLMTIK